jgi:hypothetical protein
MVVVDCRVVPLRGQTGTAVCALVKGRQKGVAASNFRLYGRGMWHYLVL